MKKKKNLQYQFPLISIIAVAVFAVCAILFIVLQKQKARQLVAPEFQLDTKNLGIFINNADHYQLSIPEGWQIITSDATDEAGVRLKRLDREYPQATFELEQANTQDIGQPITVGKFTGWSEIEEGNVYNQQRVILRQDDEEGQQLKIQVTYPQNEQTVYPELLGILTSLRPAEEATRTAFTYQSPDSFEPRTFTPFSFSFGPNWTLSNFENQYHLVLKKSGHNLEIEQGDTSGGICRFQDRPVPEPPFDSAPAIKTGFSEIITDQLTFRRITASDTNYTLCEELNGEEQFEIPTNGGLVNYQLPSDADKKIIEEMDQIISSWQYR